MFSTIMTEPLLSWLASISDLSPLAPPPDPHLTQQQIAQIKRQDMLDSFEALFEPAMEATENGEGITLFLSRDHRDLNPGRFMRWILADPVREERYKSACRVAAHLMRGDLIAKADGTDQTIDDVARSKLGVDTRFKLMALADPKDFVTTSKVDVTSTSISITAALEKAQNRLQMIVPASTTAQIEDAVVKSLPQPSDSSDSQDDDGEED